jgi:hypothetical protein
MLAAWRLSAAARGAARLTILAILLQTSLAAPFPLRMAEKAAWQLSMPTGEALRRAAPAGGRDDPGPFTPHHRHVGCLLCQGGLGPLLAGPASALAADRPIRPRLSATRAVALPPRPLAHSYPSRAPPTFA